MSCGPGQAEVINRKRVKQALADLISCMPSGSNIATLAQLVGQCSSQLEAQAVLDIAIQRAICYLNQQSQGTITALGQDFTFPELTSFNDNLYIYNAFAGSFTFPLFTDVQRGLYFSYSDNHGDGGNMSFLRFIALPLLNFVQDNFFVARCPNLTTITAPLLAHVGTDLNVASNTRLATLIITALSYLGGDFLASGSSLTGLQVPNLATWNGTRWACDSNSIPTADVNALLIQFQALSVTGKAIDFSGGGNGAPTGAGLAAKTALIMAGNTVATN